MLMNLLPLTATADGCTYPPRIPGDEPEPGELVMILGSRGSGKSTLLAQLAASVAQRRADDRLAYAARTYHRVYLVSFEDVANAVRLRVTRHGTYAPPLELVLYDGTALVAGPCRKTYLDVGETYLDAIDQYIDQDLQAAKDQGILAVCHSVFVDDGMPPGLDYFSRLSIADRSFARSLSVQVLAKHGAYGVITARQGRPVGGIANIFASGMARTPSDVSKIYLIDDQQRTGDIYNIHRLDLRPPAVKLQSNLRVFTRLTA